MFWSKVEEIKKLLIRSYGFLSGPSYGSGSECQNNSAENVEKMNGGWSFVCGLFLPFVLTSVTGYFTLTEGACCFKSGYLTSSLPGRVHLGNVTNMVPLASNMYSEWGHPIHNTIKRVEKINFFLINSTKKIGL